MIVNNYNESTFTHLLQKQIISNQSYAVAHNEEVYAQCLGYVKIMMGVTNALPYYFLVDCIEKMRNTSFYNSNTKKMIEKPLKEYKDYELTLKYGAYTGNGEKHDFFQAIIPTPEQIEIGYKFIPRNLVFDWWQDIGAMAYGQLIGRIEKLRLSVLNLFNEHNIKDAEALSYFETADALTQFSITVFDGIIIKFYNNYGVKTEQAFKDFRLTRVYDSLKRCRSVFLKEVIAKNIHTSKDLTVRSNLDKLEKVLIEHLNTSQSSHEAILENQDLFTEDFIKKYQEAYEKDMEDYKSKMSK